jgi:hypothetical protein
LFVAVSVCLLITDKRRGGVQYHQAAEIRTVQLTSDSKECDIHRSGLLKAEKTMAKTQQ